MKQELVTPQVKRLIDEMLEYGKNRDKVNAVIDAQCEKGMNEYGVPLMTNNGLKAGEEACKELADFIQYCMQQSIEYKQNGMHTAHKRWERVAKNSILLLHELVCYV